MYYGKLIVSSLFILILTYCTAHDPSRDQTQAWLSVPQVAFTPRWQVQVGQGTGKDYYILTPQVVNGKVYAADHSGNLFAFEERTGVVVWRTRITQRITSAPGVGDNQVFIGTAKSTLVAFATDDGKKQWVTKLPGIILTAPIYSQNKVIVKTLDGQVIAFNSDTGKEIWHYQETISNLMLRSASGITIAKDRVLVGFHNGRLVMLNLTDGKVIWQRQLTIPMGFSELERMVDIDVTPLVKNDKIYVADYQGRIMALRFATGAPLWEHAISSYSGLMVHGEAVIVGDIAGNLWSFDSYTGRVNWCQKKLKGRLLVGPVAYQHHLIVADNEGNIFWLSPDDGRIVKRTYFDKSGMITPPVVHNDHLYILARSGKLAAK